MYQICYLKTYHNNKNDCKLSIQRPKLWNILNIYKITIKKNIKLNLFLII